MKRNLLASLVLALITISLYAQDPNILWQRTIGGSEDDRLYSINKTSDGGYILGGISESNISGDKTENNIGFKNYWIVKLDENGSIQWQNTIGGNIRDYLKKVVQTSDGGYIIGGYSDSQMFGDKTENAMGSYDYWVVKLDSSGEIQWENTIGGNGEDILYDIIQTNDDGYLLAGSSNSNISFDKTEDSKGMKDYWLVKLNDQGVKQWDKTIGGNSGDILYSIILTSDNGLLLGGYSASDISGDKSENHIGMADYWVIKLDSSYNIEWQNTIGGNDTDTMEAVLETSDGGFILAGNSLSNISGDKTENSNGLYDMWVVKVNNLGNIVWQNTLGGNESDFLRAIAASNDGGYLLAGSSQSVISGDKNENTLGLTDIWVLKINANGILTGQNSIGGNGIEGAFSVLQDTDGGFVIGGASDSYISGDKTQDPQGSFDYWVVKIDSSLSIEENPFTTSITLYPNPAKNTLQLNTQDKTIDQINIYTMTGSKVLQLDAETISPTVDVSSLATGVYYIQLYSGKNVALKKFVKE
jgi:hypothetical protein